MTLFEARFFYGINDNTVYLGCEGGSINHSIEKITSGQAELFMKRLFHSLFTSLSFNPIIPFTQNLINYINIYKSILYNINSIIFDRFPIRYCFPRSSIQ